MRPSESWITTPYSRVSGTFFTVRVAIPPALRWRSTRPFRSASVRASPETITTGSSPKKSATLRTPSGRAEQLLLEAVLEPVPEVVADRVGVVVEVRDQLAEPLALEHPDDVGHHGPVEHRDHRLGDLEGDRLEAGAETRCEDHRLHGAGTLAASSPASCAADKRPGRASGKRPIDNPEISGARTADALAAVRRLSSAVLGAGDHATVYHELASAILGALDVDEVQISRVLQDLVTGRGNAYLPGRRRGGRDGRRV